MLPSPVLIQIYVLLLEFESFNYLTSILDSPKESF